MYARFIATLVALQALMGLGGPCARAHGNNIVLVATPANTSGTEQYVPIQKMDLVCGRLFLRLGFRCSATWESGAIGAYVPERHAHVPLTAAYPGLVCGEDLGHTTLIEKVARTFVVQTDLVPRKAYNWTAERGMAMSPTVARDGTYVWVRTASIEC
jgi:hypothetical protein